MARQYAPLYTNIWQDPEFKKLSAQAQRVYLISVSQSNMSWCGVVSYTARRWSSFSSGTSPRQIASAVAELVAAEYVILDEETEELWVRSFIKHNNVESQPKLIAAARRQFTEIHSEGIRRGIAKAYPGVCDTPGEGVAKTPVLGVDGEVSGVEEPLPTSHLTPSPAALAQYRAEAEREADAWKKRDPNAIVSREGWIKKRIKTLTKVYGGGEMPKDEVRAIGPVCPSPDCRRGHNVAVEPPVPCEVCRIHISEGKAS